MTAGSPQSSSPRPAVESAALASPAASVLRALSLVLLAMTVVAYLMGWAIDADSSLDYQTGTLGLVVVASMGMMTLVGALVAAGCGWWLKRRGR